MTHRADDLAPGLEAYTFREPLNVLQSRPVTGSEPTWPFSARSRYLRSVLRSARLLGAADAAAIVSHVDASLRVQMSEPPGVLVPGSAIAVHPSLRMAPHEGPASADAFQWCPTNPPEGFRYAYVLDGGALNRRGLLLLVANESRTFHLDRLRLVSARLWLGGGAPGLRPLPATGEAPGPCAG